MRGLETKKASPLPPWHEGQFGRRACPEAAVVAAIFIFEISNNMTVERRLNEMANDKNGEADG